MKIYKSGRASGKSLIHEDGEGNLYIMVDEKQLTPLEASKQLKDFICELELGNVDKLFIKGSFNIIETALKALEIIKEKKVNVGSFIKCCADIDYKKYYKGWSGWKKDILYNLSSELLTEKEFDLLKEVLL